MNIFYRILLTIGKWMVLFVLPFIIMIIFFKIYYFIRGYRRKKGQTHRCGHGSKLKRLFWDFPKRFAKDFYEKDPDFFPEYGMRVIAGKQGSGKTITLIYLLLWYKKQYPLLKIKSNLGYAYEDGQIEDWHDLIKSENGIYGEIDVLDEVQNWFNSMESKDFPPELLTEITQQRKQRKMILCTSQVFSRVAKPIREQTYQIYLPTTLFGCITFVRRYEPIIDQKGDMKEKKLRGFFFFVHTEEIRNAFDTYKKIERMAEKGFKSEQDQIHSESHPHLVAEVKKKGRKKDD